VGRGGETEKQLPHSTSKFSTFYFNFNAVSISTQDLKQSRTSIEEPDNCRHKMLERDGEEL